MLSRLDSGVVESIRSSFNISSQAQAVEELVLNAVDAGALNIVVSVDASNSTFEVRDDGRGMTKTDLEIVGERYATSKCHTLDDLNSISTFGFRGEALSSLAKLAILEIVTRSTDSMFTLTKIMQAGQVVKMGRADYYRNIGTTVTVRDLFFTMPVRKKRLAKSSELEKIKQSMERIALIHPNVSFALYDASKGTKIFQTRKLLSLHSSFTQLFGSNKAASMQEFEFTYDQFRLSGLFSLVGKGHNSKSFQFCYLNRRYITKTPLHSHINRKWKFLASKHSFRTDDEEEDGAVAASAEDGKSTQPFVASKIRGGAASSPKRIYDKYPMFVVNIDCPPTIYDITFEPAKTLVEFKNWDKVFHAVNKLLAEIVEKQLKGRGLAIESSQEDDETSSCLTTDSSQSREDDSYESQEMEYHEPPQVKGKEREKEKEQEADHHVMEEASRAYSLEEEEEDFEGEYITCDVDLEQFVFSPVITSTFATPTSVERATPSSSSSCSSSSSSSSSYSSSSSSSPSSSSSSSSSYSTADTVLQLTTIRDAPVTSHPSTQSSAPKPGHSSSSSEKELLQRSRSVFAHLPPPTLSSRSRALPPFPVTGLDVSSTRKRKLGNFQTKTTTPFSNASGKPLGYAKPLSLHHHSDVQHQSSGLSTSSGEEAAFILSRSTPPASSSAFTNIPSHQSSNEEHFIKRSDSSCTVSHAAETVDDSPTKRRRLHRTNSGPPFYVPATRAVHKNPPFSTRVCVEALFDNNFTQLQPVEKDIVNDEKSVQVKEEEEEIEKSSPEIASVHTMQLVEHNKEPQRPKIDPFLLELLQGKRTYGSAGEERIMDIGANNDLGRALRGASATITKDLVRRMRVINQVDNKFILTEESGFLYILDQHAVDERIGLEKLFKDVFGVNGDERNIQSQAIAAGKIDFKATSRECRLFELYRAQIESWGYRFSVLMDHSEGEGSITVRAVPSVLNVALTKPEDLKEFVVQLDETRGSRITKPKAIIRLLQSKSCRNAIMFGDALTKHECEMMLGMVATCDLPFQCAHGRPSMIPLLDTTEAAALLRVGEPLASLPGRHHRRRPWAFPREKMVRVVSAVKKKKNESPRDERYCC